MKLLKWTPVSRPFFALNKFASAGLLSVQVGAACMKPPLAIPAFVSALGSHPGGPMLGSSVFMRGPSIRPEGVIFQGVGDRIPALSDASFLFDLSACAVIDRRRCPIAEALVQSLFVVESEPAFDARTSLAQQRIVFQVHLLVFQ
jgi:hypothetical protein